MPSLKALPFSWPGATLIALGICAAAMLSSELAYRAGLADTPGSFRRFYGAPAEERSQTPGGQAADALDAMISRAHWSAPGLLPRLQQFKTDGASFYEMLNNQLGERVTPQLLQAQAAARNLLDRRDGYFADTATLRRRPALSRSAPADSAALSSDER